MSGTGDIIKRILALRPQLTREAVERLIDEERAKAAGLLTEEAAAHLVASNLGLDGAGERIEAKLRIGDLTSGLSDVSLTGRVIHIFPARSFSRSDGREGRVLRMLLGDRTGTVNVVCWDDRADHVAASKVRPGKIVRVLHGYTRERRGEIEVNVGNRGQIYLEPLDAAAEDYPPVDGFFRTPADIHGAGSVNLVGVVVDRHPVSTFTRRDGSAGKVTRLVLEEGGGRINVVLWDDKVDELGDIEVGTRLRLVNGSARVRTDRGIEVHVGWSTAVEVLEVGAEPDEPVSPWMKLADLTSGMRGVNVAARVAQISEAREFTRRDGTAGRVASVLLEDDTGSVRLNLWGEEAEMLKEMEVGAVVVVENGYTRMGLGTVGLNVGQNGRLTINPQGFDVESWGGTQRLVELQSLREGMGNIIVRGRLIETAEVREVETARGPARVASFRIDDGTGEARVSIWRDLIEEVEGLPPGTAVRIENCNVRQPFDGLMQVSSGLFTRIIVEKE
ncbi:hypothetical protein AC482_00180 [miscellaneous Crenarchaeota group-15 archaeon DG-45]|uniref:OB domain-containing protein n=1 Tax=miscellaneous Crenarchaeota group-15 archaeon DG-45 TaxID=1685127 RepID=A0A0M0BT31_9ARCH|nr:MAG: hypothetical protein AC482_00180 [miscellaneous Crenarchaeota group-15 archaeon DG-45]